MSRPIRILLQTTIPPIQDDWNISRFSLLQEHLASLKDGAGSPLYDMTARDRETNITGDDPVLSQLDRSDFDQLWLFALDTGDGLSAQDCAGINRFHEQGGGIFTTRDHQDMGVSMLGLPSVGVYHYFHSQNLDPDESRCCIDDCYTTTISWPNYHSGRNGDYQTITPVGPIHELLRKPDGGVIEFFPAHPHEGGIGVRFDAPHTRVIATGKSLVTGRTFNLVVVGDRSQSGNGKTPGRLVAQSTFHHLVDYNWDID